MYHIPTYPLRISHFKVALLIPILAISMLSMAVTLPVQTGISLTPTGLEKLSPVLRSELNTILESGEPNTPMRILVQTLGAHEALVDIISSFGGAVSHIYKYVNMLSAVVPADKVMLLAGDSSVDYVFSDEKIHMEAPREPGKSDDVEMIGGTMDPAWGDFDLIGTQQVDAGDIMVLEVTEEQMADFMIPSNYYNYFATEAYKVWGAAAYGWGTTIAVIDNGVYAYHPLIYPSVIGGHSTVPGEPEWNSPLADHGTFCTGLIVGNSLLGFLAGHPVITAITNVDPGLVISLPDYPGLKWIPFFGIAPLAQIYAEKVMVYEGWGYTSWIMEGIEHVIDLRLTEELHVDVISMSIGGASLEDGNDPEELLLDYASNIGIKVVVAAGNEGPAIYTTSRPGTARTVITVGASCDDIHTDIYYNFLHLVTPPDDPDWYWFSVFNPKIRARVQEGVHTLSSRGPARDGRLDPDVTACGIFDFSTLPPYDLGWGSGTSFSTPQVAGAAALLTAYYKATKGVEPEWWRVKAAIMKGAVPKFVGEYPLYAQGRGYLNIANAAALLETVTEEDHDELTSIEFYPEDFVVTFTDGVFTATVSDLPVGHNEQFFVPVTLDTDALKVTVTNVELHDTSRDNLEFYWCRVGITNFPYPYLVDSWNIYWKETVTFILPINYMADPGYQRVVIENDWTNMGPAGATIIIEKIEDTLSKGKNGAVNIASSGATAPVWVAAFPGSVMEDSGVLDEGALYVDFIEVPDGTVSLSVELAWEHSWATFPTADLDLYLIDPLGLWHYFEPTGGTIASPELFYTAAPMSGVWIIAVDGYNCPAGPEPFMVKTTLITGAPVWVSKTTVLAAGETVKIKLPRKLEYGVIRGYADIGYGLTAVIGEIGA